MESALGNRLFSGILGQPREVLPKFRNEIPENVCSIRFHSRNFPEFLVEWKAPRASPASLYEHVENLQRKEWRGEGCLPFGEKIRKFRFQVKYGKVIFRKFRSEIVEYLQRYSSFSVRNGTAVISVPFAKLSSFQSLISRKQLREIEVQMVRKRHFVRLVC